MRSVFIAGGASYNAVISLDAFPEPQPQTIHNCDYDETIGNTGAGKSLSLSRLGFKVNFQTLLGNDEYASRVELYLDHPNIELHTETDPNVTERHLNILDSNGHRISIFTNPSSNAPKIDYTAYKDLIKRSDEVVINISNYCRYFLPLCQSLNKTIWTDLHDYDGHNVYHQDFIEASDYIFLSSDNFENYKRFMHEMIDKGKKLVVCTHGRDGASAMDARGHWIDIPAISAYSMVNTNGAGDAFFSGFLYAHVKGYDLLKCLQMATIVGGLTIESTELVNISLSELKLENEYQKYYG
ncbi:MAG: PfkB family carbohydrate kinase [Bacteroidota bacterium]